MISTNNHTEATQAMDDVTCAHIRVDWLDLILQRIHKDRQCQPLFQKVFTTQVKEQEAYLHQTKNLPKKARQSLAKKKPSSTSMMNYQITILQRFAPWCGCLLSLLSSSSDSLFSHLLMERVPSPSSSIFPFEMNEKYFFKLYILQYLRYFCSEHELLRTFLFLNAMGLKSK